MKPALRRALSLLCMPILFLAVGALLAEIPAFGLSKSALASDAPLKAGMIDPKTGKKIKYWVAPMDPTYIRYEPGKSPMGMDLVPKYEEEDEAKEPASTIRIDPVTIQNMGVRYGMVARAHAQRMLNAARQRLEYWDLTEAQIQDIEKKGAIYKELSVYSPTAGVVIKKDAYEGHYVTAGAHQFDIADLSTVWVDADIYEYELPWVHKGMPARMELPYLPGRTFSGQVLFIYPYLDTKTRTARLRLTFDNRDGQLKPGMYANVYLQSALPSDALVIPQEAVIDSGVRKLVFVARDKGKFEPREVQLGVEGDNYEIQVLKGLKEGEKIVVSGQFMLDSESRLREAIQKMLEPQKAESQAEDLDKKNMTKDDDLEMKDMDMGNTPK
ncbi:MAG: efflux RND transporter periplasmic adaptor subunit [Desulfobacteraceae bacterium]|nr:efflux RND transporter periplasmic adaptor subunit [Desulfobacteraceae bacterium]